jgi:hypothetical protein
MLLVARLVAGPANPPSPATSGGYVEQMATPGEVHRAYSEELGERERSALWSWLGFTVTFATVRTITYGIRDNIGPFHNLSVGGIHLHHYMWGIGMVSAVGAVAVTGEEKTRRHPAAAATYGSGLALIVDEFALLLDLRDVYWARQGRISVDLGIGLVAVGGTILSAVPMIQRLVRDRRRSPRRRQLGSVASDSSTAASPASSSA